MCFTKLKGALIQAHFYVMFVHEELSEPSCGGLLLPPHRYHGFTSHHRFSKSGEMRNNWPDFIFQRAQSEYSEQKRLFAAITSVWTLELNKYPKGVSASCTQIWAWFCSWTKCLCKFAVVRGSVTTWRTWNNVGKQYQNFKRCDRSLELMWAVFKFS